MISYCGVVVVSVVCALVCSSCSVECLERDVYKWRNQSRRRMCVGIAVVEC